ncbi:MAG: hypothetical protein ACI4ES_07705 [Roseburia sp.]
MRNNWKNRVKKMMTMVMMASMLLTVVTVSSEGNYGTVPYGDGFIESEISE